MTPRFPGQASAARSRYQGIRSRAQMDIPGSKAAVLAEDVCVKGSLNDFC